MYASMPYFTPEVMERLSDSRRVVLMGISMAMCNAMDQLSELYSGELLVCDPLFDQNPKVQRFRNQRVISAIEAYQLDDTAYLVTSFSGIARANYLVTLQEQCKDAFVLEIRAEREIRLEASGICNLRCMSCPCGNTSPEDFSFGGRGFLTVERCERILEKLGREYPDNLGLFYYIFGEPFLNPALPALIETAHSHGLSVCVSSNFSFVHPIEQVAAAKPDLLKISISGMTQETYGHHHNGGSIERVLINMEKLFAMMPTIESKTAVVVGYHIYGDNSGEEYEAARQLCAKYGFLFSPVRAIYNNPLKRMGITQMTEEDRRFLETYYETPERYLSLSENLINTQLPCRNLTDKLFLDYDGSVMLCELLHKDAFFRSFLAVPRQQIEVWREAHPLCKICRKHNMHLV